MIYDISPFTTLDYPNHLAAIVWFGGCNMRCKYCYNPQIVLAKPPQNRGSTRTHSGVSMKQLEDFLRSRVGLLDAIVASGGECTTSDKLFSVCRLAKNLGFKVKIDSNASAPDKLLALHNQSLADFFSLDFKAPANKFAQLCGKDFSAEFFASVKALLRAGAAFEVRTTWHFDLLSEADIWQMHEQVRKAGFAGTYALQGFLPVPNLAKLSASDKQINMSKFRDYFELRNF